MKKLSLLFAIPLCLPISNVISCSSKKSAIGGFKKTVSLNGFELDFEVNYISDIKIKFDSFRKDQFKNVSYYPVGLDNYLSFDLKDVTLMSFEVNRELIEYKFELGYSASSNNQFDQNVSLSEALAMMESNLNANFLSTIRDNLNELKGLLETKVAGSYGFSKLDFKDEYTSSIINKTINKRLG